MSDHDVIQSAYEESLVQIYNGFVSAFTEAKGDQATEAELDAHFLRSVAHARHLRDRALALLGARPAARRKAPAST